MPIENIVAPRPLKFAALKKEPRIFFKVELVCMCLIDYTGYVSVILTCKSAYLHCEFFRL